MSAKFVKSFGIIGLVVAVILAIAFKEKILLIAGVYWASLILLTIILRFANPKEFKTLKSESDEGEKDSEIEIDDLDSGDDANLIRDSFLNGKYSFIILVTCFIAVLVGGFVFIAFTGIEYDESQIYIANENSFNRRFEDFIAFQVVPLIVVAALSAICCVSIYEVISGVASKTERKEYNVSLLKSISLAVIPLAIVFVFIFSVQNWATIVTEDGVEIHRPCTATVYYQWEDMTSFTCDKVNTIFPEEVDIEFENGEETHIDFRHFEKESDMFYETYGKVYKDGKRVSATSTFFKHIFLEEYAHLNANN